MINTNLLLNDVVESFKHVVFDSFWIKLLSLIGIIGLFVWKKITRYAKKVRMNIFPIFWSKKKAKKALEWYNINGKYNKELAVYKKIHPHNYEQLSSAPNSYDQVINNMFDMINKEGHAWKESPPQMFDKFYPYSDEPER